MFRVHTRHTRRRLNNQAACLQSMFDPSYTPWYSLVVGITGGVVTIVFSVFLGNLSSDYRGHVDMKPSFKTAATLGGFYDKEGMFLGGAPRWNDWTDGIYSCVAASDNATYCGEWSTERFYSGAQDDFLRGTCSCSRPQPLTDAIVMTLALSRSNASDVLYPGNAHVCSAWGCDETRYTKTCKCDAYESTTTCTPNPTPTPTPTRRPSPTPTPTPPTPTPNNNSFDDDDDDYDDDDARRLLEAGAEVAPTSETCKTKNTCVSTSCWFEETKLYTTCSCDPDGDREREAGPTWWTQDPYCEQWSCNQGTEALPLDDGLLDLNGTQSYVVSDYELSYTCSEDGSEQGGSAVWCGGWRGMTSVPGNIREQLCRCSTANTTSDGVEGFCQEWRCSTYFMTRCKGCSVVLGSLLGVLFLLIAAPLVVQWFMGSREGLFAAPFAITGSTLLAVYLGGVALLWTVLLPTAVAIITVGRVYAKHLDSRGDKISPEEAEKLEDNTPEAGLQDDTPEAVDTPQPTPQQQVLANTSGVEGEADY